MPRERNVFVFVVTANVNERILGTEPGNWRGRAVASHADPADQLAAFVKRNAARRSIERAERHRQNRQARRWTERNYAPGLFEFVDVGKKQIGKSDSDERSGRGVVHPGRKVLLNNESRSP